MRIEIKIPYNLNNVHTIEGNLESLKNLRQHHPTRKINSIYFDNLNNQIARDNINGISKRCKFRIRHYGDDQESNCYLEIKKKLNKFGFKKIIDMQSKISDVKLNEVFLLNKKIYKEVINDSYGKEYIFQDFMSPQVLVSYSRDYFIVDKIRITHDKAISFEPFGIDKLSTQKKINDYLNVLEIKFDYENLNDAQHILQKIQAKPKRFSKYLRGLSFFNSSIYI
tara:strand:- start:38 stop:709 length:672 start_codon:yes stop_codon:yes gene_type:complete